MRSKTGTKVAKDIPSMRPAAPPISENNFFFLYFQDFESNLLVPQCNSGFPSETQLFYQDIAEEDFNSEI